METRHSRTALVLGEEGVKKLNRSSVCVFGLGGVGSYCAEALARVGVGKLTLVDKDRVEESNINRQLVATYKTLACAKAEVMAARVKDVSPRTEVIAKELFYLPETADELPFDFDFIADCVDNVTAKITICERAFQKKIPVISAMGAGNRTDITSLRVAPLEKTSVCPLARVMRRELKARSVTGVTAVYSLEEPIRTGETLGSLPTVPAAMGLIIAQEIIKRLVP